MFLVLQSSSKATGNRGTLKEPLCVDAGEYIAAKTSKAERALHIATWIKEANPEWEVWLAKGTVKGPKVRIATIEFGKEVKARDL